MVAVHIAGHGTCDRGLLEAMATVPRERVVAAGTQESGYENNPLTIDAGEMTSQPHIVALTIEAADLGVGNRLLEVGAGSDHTAESRNLGVPDTYLFGV